MIEAFSPGAEGHAPWSDLDVRAEELNVQKRRFAAFAPGASDLHAILRQRGVDTLIITGTASQVCRESSARDVMMLNCKVFSVADGYPTFTDEEHNATLSAMAYTLCDVIESNSLIALIQHATAAREGGVA
jgi:ureidoacrylate peracid hydrolase